MLEAALKMRGGVSLEDEVVDERTSEPRWSLESCRPIARSEGVADPGCSVHWPNALTTARLFTVAGRALCATEDGINRWRRPLGIPGDGKAGETCACGETGEK